MGLYVFPFRVSAGMKDRCDYNYSLLGKYFIDDKKWEIFNPALPVI
jgi:hypothetical protein